MLKSLISAVGLRIADTYGSFGLYICNYLVKKNDHTHTGIIIYKVMLMLFISPFKMINFFYLDSSFIRKYYFQN